MPVVAALAARLYSPLSHVPPAHSSQYEVLVGREVPQPGTVGAEVLRPRAVGRDAPGLARLAPRYRGLARLAAMHPAWRG
jgi:hypothetical protein